MGNKVKCRSLKLETILNNNTPDHFLPSFTTEIWKQTSFALPSYKQCSLCPGKHQTHSYCGLYPRSGRYEGVSFKTSTPSEACWLTCKDKLVESKIEYHELLYTFKILLSGLPGLKSHFKWVHAFSPAHCPLSSQWGAHIGSWYTSLAKGQSLRNKREQTCTAGKLSLLWLTEGKADPSPRNLRLGLKRCRSHWSERGSW